MAKPPLSEKLRRFKSAAEMLPEGLHPEKKEVVRLAGLLVENAQFLGTEEIDEAAIELLTEAKFGSDFDPRTIKKIVAVTESLKMCLKSCEDEKSMTRVQFGAAVEVAASSSQSTRANVMRQLKHMIRDERVSEDTIADLFSENAVGWCIGDNDPELEADIRQTFLNILSVPSR